MEMKNDITVSDMMDMQKRLFDKFGEKHNWLTYTPDQAKNHWLFMFGEAGEVVDDLKKKGEERLMQPGPEREHMVEEMADTMMFFTCTMLCMGVTPEEFSKAYIEKHNKNMNRW